MAKLNEAKTILKAADLIQLLTNEAGTPSLTPLLSGQAGVGKTQIMKSVASDLNALFKTVDGTLLNDGEITGYPLISSKDDGDKEVRFVKHYAISSIYDLQKYYFMKAKTTGLLNGRIKVIDDERGLVTVIDGKEHVQDVLERIQLGEDNRYLFGEDFSPEIKLQLIRSGEIKPFLLFFDEINRCDQTVMRQLMNIILQREVNGYKFPWWVIVNAAMNPANPDSPYATTQMDPAQRDRFCKIPVTTDIRVYSEFAIEKGLNREATEALLATETIFMSKNANYSDNTDDMEPSPRSHQILANVNEWLGKVLATPFFTNDEKKKYDMILRAIAVGKIGNTAGTTWLGNLKNNDTATPAEKMFDCKSEQLPKEMKERLTRQNSLRQQFTVSAVISWIRSNYEDLEKGFQKGSDEDKRKFKNFVGQYKDFLSTIEKCNVMYLYKTISTHTEEDRYRLEKSKKPIVFSIMKYAQEDIIKELYQYVEIKNKLGNE